MRILIADDHEVVRRGLKDLLRDEFGDVVFGEASDGNGVVALLDEGDWDLVLLDVVMPSTNVIDLIGEVRRHDEAVPILILTATPETEYAVSTLRATANGYMTKQLASEELIGAVRKVLAGETYLSGDAARAVADAMRTDARGAPHDTLSARELQVLSLIAKGKAVKEVAYELSVSAKTVATYVARIRVKTGLLNYVDMARYALQHKLVD